MGYITMTPVQEQAIPHLLSGVDFLGQAPTGTGKTAAFAIPLVQQVTPGLGHVQALIVAPTRELVQQIAEEINAIGRVKGVQALAVFGGERIHGQKERLRQRDVDIVVGTPGRLLDHLGQVSLDFSRTRLVILDECDEMLDMGFIDDIERILAQTPQGRQTWLFSATMSPESLKVADRHLMYPESIRIAPQRHAAEIITQYYIILDEKDKVPELKKLLKSTDDLYGIVFCRSKRGVVELTRQLRDRYPVECVHGAMPQHNRDTAMAEFRDKKYKLMVATDVLARGIDIDKLTHIINYDPPHDPESYIHRIGRTARAGETGIAITFFTPDEEYDFRQLEKRVGIPLTRHPDCVLDFAPGGGAKKKRRGRGGSSGGGSYGAGRGASSRSRGEQRPQRSENTAPTGENASKPRRRRRRPKSDGTQPRESRPSSGQGPTA